MVQGTTITLTRPDIRWANRNKDHSLDRSLSSDDHPLRLVRRIAAGDEAALRELYKTYGQRLFAYAVRLTRNSTLAEDVVQESLIAAWQGARHFRGESRVLVWLLGIVHHKALNAVRVKSPSLLDEEGDELPSDAPPLEEQMVGHEQAALLRRGLDGLSLKHRMVLELVFYQGLNLSEVARICACPVGTIKSRLSYAKDYMRRTLERAGLKAEDLR